MSFHHYLSASGPLLASRKSATPRKRLAIAAGVGTTVAQEAIRLYTNKEDPNDSVNIGRPKVRIGHELIIAIRTVILEGNKTGNPVSSNILLSELASKHDIIIHKRTLIRYLKKLKFHYGKGARQNILHDSQSVIDYRNLYVERRLSNLNANGLPILPEVFLDEFYCDLPGGVVNERGRKPMLVIFGAFVVFRVDNKLRSELIRKSFLIRPVKGQARGRLGSRAADSELWRSVPDAVKNSGIAPDYPDYHGNFDADLFENLFEGLCQTLEEDYGPCHIHMDGAKYHMRKENSLPNSQTKVDDVRKWFVDNNLPLPTNANGSNLTKAELLFHIKEANIPPQFTSYNIASRHGHTILKTPPYHCELQPIEKVWGMGKNPIAANPRMDETELSLRNRLLELFTGLTETQLIAVWKETVRINRDYHELYEAGLEFGADSEEEGESDWSEEEI